MSPRTTEGELVPTDRIWPIVKGWIAEHEDLEHALQRLEANSPIQADTWRRRLSNETYVGKSGSELARGWFARLEVEAEKVDEFLTAADLTDLWYSELRDLLPIEERVTDEEFDETCAVCGRWIDFARGDRGVRVELKRPRKWTQWWSICSLCLVEKYPARGFGQLELETLKMLYRRYIEQDVGIGELGEWYFRSVETTFKDGRACASSIRQGWTRNGWPLRRRGLQVHLNHKRGKRRRRKADARIPDDVIRKLHLLHTRGKAVSINALGKQLYERYGYASANTCGVSIADGFKRLGLQARGRIEMTIAVSTKHGRKRRYQKGTASADYKRWLKKQRGEQYDEPCTSTTTRGTPCQARAMLGKDVCQHHDPERREATLAHLERMRAQRPLHDPALLEPIGPLQAELRECFETLGSWKPLAEASHFNRRYLSHVAGTKQCERINRVRAAELRAAIAAVMPAELERAA
jgi:hypothetical protein